MKGKVLGEPFVGYKGYTVFHKTEGRYYMNLVPSCGSTLRRRTMSLARYKVCVKEKRILLPHEHVDHRDENKTNDRLSNLQILSPSDNTKKSNTARGVCKKLIDFVCPVCGNVAQISKRRHYHRKTCGRACGNTLIARTLTGRSRIPAETIVEIKRLRESGLSSYKISGTVGVDRNTVMKYWGSSP